jgi:hypothetical protein
MSRAEFQCAECGASVQVWGSSRSEADRKAAWHKKEGHVCDACAAKRRAAENEAAAQTNNAAGLPNLIGSEKQVAWAETIRKEILERAAVCAALIEKMESADHMNAIGYEGREALNVEMREMLSGMSGYDRDYTLFFANEVLLKIRHAVRYSAFMNLLARQVRASWWIDVRDADLHAIIKAMKKEIDAEIEAARPVSAEQVAAMQEAQAEALLKPAGEPKSSQIAEIRLVGDQLRVIFPEKREDFRLLMRNTGFIWDNAWVRTMGATTGNTLDRQAETAHRIIAAGFMVRLHDEEAREKAISGQFEPEQTRWVARANGGEYKGWLVLSWARTEDFYVAAKRILGARYKHGRVHVPPGSVLEVADFAAQYGFALTPGAQEILTAHQAALAAGAVIADPKQGAEPVRIAESAKPPKLDPATVGGDIDPGLREEPASASERFASYLLHRRELQGSSIELPLSQRKFAAMLGIRAETLNRMLSKLARQGILHGKGRKWEILVPEALECMAAGKKEGGLNHG